RISDPRIAVTPPLIRNNVIVNNIVVASYKYVFCSCDKYEDSICNNRWYVVALFAAIPPEVLLQLIHI
ncbi:hypothetical protein, partial [Escherichia coli]|uniref:hypothetical protein n=1 Tax=Escherichia coli TaxID=562 RepID=UPI001BFD7C4C